MAKPPSVKDKILQHFLAHPGKQYTFQELLQRFGTSQNNISSHLKSLRDDKLHQWLLNPRKGLWELNPRHKTDNMIRLQGEEAGKLRVISTDGYQHGRDTITPVIVNTTHLKNHTSSIMKRMEKADNIFTPEDIELVADLLKSRLGSDKTPLVSV